MPALYVDDMIVGEGDGFVDIVIRLDAPAAAGFTVNYATAAGTASASYDYTSVTGTLTFDVGQQFATVRVNLLQSGSYDTGVLEHFRFNLTSPTNGVTLGKSSGMVTIIDNDNAVPFGGPTLYVRDVVVDEKAGTATFAVLLGGVNGQAVIDTVTVNYATQAGTAAAVSDFAGATGSLTFNPGETVKLVTININDDGADEGVENFFLNLSGATNATIIDGRGVATIGRSDGATSGSPTLSVTDMIVGEGDGYIDVVVQLSAPSTGPIAVNYTTANGSADANYDYEAVSGTLNFAAGETTKVVRVELLGSGSYDYGDIEYFRFNLSAPAGGATLGQASSMITVIDNDNTVAVGQPSLFVRDVTVDEKAGTATFVVLLGGVRGQAVTSVVTAEYEIEAGSATAGSDYAAGISALSGTLTFGVGETVKTITVDIRDDLTAEGVERFLLNLTSATNATIVDNRAVATIGKSDQTTSTGPTLSVADMIVGEGDGYVDVVVQLSAPSTGAIAVNYTTANGSADANYDYMGASGTLNFAAGETTKVVRIEMLGSGSYDYGTIEHFRFNLSSPAGGATLGKSSSMITVIDNDNAVTVGQPTLLVRDVVVDEKAGTATFTVLLGGVYGQAANSPVTVDYDVVAGTAAEGADYREGSEALSGTLTFGVGETVKTVTVDILDDSATELEERFNLVLSNANGANIVDGHAAAVIGASDAASSGLPTIIVAATTVNESDGYVDVVLRLSAPTASGAAVNYATANSSASSNYDYFGASGIAVFAAGETTKVVRIELLESASYDSAGIVEQFFFNLSTAVNATIGNTQTVVTIVDDDAGVRVLSYGISDDIYTVLQGTDQIVENAGGGLDLVLSEVTYTAPINVENLTLTGVAAINGTGNGSDNLIVGNESTNTLSGLAGNDTLDGGAGNDTMLGALGDDVYFVAQAGDVVTELGSQGTDTVMASITYTLAAEVENLTLLVGAVNGIGNALANVITGNGVANTLTGLAGADTLDGGGGNDTAVGGGGNDTYIVGSTADVIEELADQGNDAVTASATYTLSANVEQLTLANGAGAINGTGNDLDNLITGNNAKNTINGGLGADTMVGGGGNDLYTADQAGDVITEATGQGDDLVRAGFTYTLGANLERLVLTGISVIDGNGNELDNQLTGNGAVNRLSGLAGNDTLSGGIGDDTLLGGGGNDILVGGPGNDFMTGGLGVDTFQFTNTAGADRVSDFTSGLDRLRFSQAALPVGNADLVIDGAVSVAGPGSFSTAAELVIVTGNIVGAVNTTSAAAAIGSASSAYGVGDTRLFAVDNGSVTGVFLFTSAAADATVTVDEIRLVALLTGTAATTATDFGFIA